MKNIKIDIRSISLLVGLLVALVLQSCEGILDEQPESQLGEDKFWQDNTDLEAGVLAAYDALQQTYRVKHFLWGEFRSDNYAVHSGGSANPQIAGLVRNNVGNDDANAVRWNTFYTLVGRANAVIANAESISGFDGELLGEAKMMRAYAYFDAIRVWGDVPLFTEPVTNFTPDVFRGRTDADFILQEVVIPDMLDAEDLIQRPFDKYRFSKNSVWAFQAQVYMWTKEYDKAKTAMDNIIASGEYSLVTTPQDWQNLFINDLDGVGKIQEGPEIIMSINYTLTEDGGNNRSGIFSIFFAGLPSIVISPTLTEKWLERFPVDSAAWVAKYPTSPPNTITTFEGQTIDFYGDWRLVFSREGAADFDIEFNGGGPRMAKYNKTNYSPGADDSDIILFRYADILLMLAEAENRLNNEDRALELVNEIRIARGLPQVTAAEFGATVDAREDYILDERQFELLGEGRRWWDLVRTDKAIEVLNPILANDPDAEILNERRLRWPVYFEHLIENDSLSQTPGY